jgi:hypothetical protein
MEALRIGYSFQSKFISRTTVEYCLFTKCNGDGEIISNKAREDVFRYNTFKDNGESHLTLRHGSNNVVYGNFFLNGAGVRIKEGQNQMVYNNYFNTGKYFSLRLENYKVDPLKNIQIVHNIFAQSGFMKLGGKGDYPPKKVIFCMNLIINSIDPFITDQSGSEVCQGNAIQPEWSLDLAGFTTIKSTIQPNSAGLLQPEKQISKIKYGESAFNLYDIPELGDDPLIDLDIMGNKRPSSFSKKDPGCFQIGGEKQVRPYADGSNTGPSYLKD